MYGHINSASSAFSITFPLLTCIINFNIEMKRFDWKRSNVWSQISNLITKVFKWFGSLPLRCVKFTLTSGDFPAMLLITTWHHTTAHLESINFKLPFKTAFIYGEYLMGYFARLWNYCNLHYKRMKNVGFFVAICRSDSCEYASPHST